MTDQQTKQPHVHAELIKAWADGAEIQCKQTDGKWLDVYDPVWITSGEYRIKPEPEPDLIVNLSLDITHSWKHVRIKSQWEGDCPAGYSHNPSDLKLIFDGETGKLKKVEIVE